MLLCRWSSVGERQLYYQTIDVAVALMVTAPFIDISSMSKYLDTAAEHDFAMLFLIHALMIRELILSPIVDTTIDWELDPVIVEDLQESDCLAYFRFRQVHLQHICNLLWPRMYPFLQIHPKLDLIRCKGYVCPYETGMLMVLYRFSRPVRLRPEMEKFFHTRKSKISAIIYTFVRALFQVCFPYFVSPSIWHSQMPYYAELIQRKSNNAVLTTWSFIDGTLRKTCRPVRFQRQAYSGHKRHHGIKFQSLVIPEGLIACLYGPIAGHRHDSYMLTESNILPQVRELMPLDGSNGTVYQIYGDPAYPQCGHLFGGFRNPNPGTLEALWNTEMSKVREVVEWAYGEIPQKFAYLDFKANMKIFKEPIAMYYFVAAFFINIYSTIYRNKTATYFECELGDTLNTRQYIEMLSVEYIVSKNIECGVSFADDMNTDFMEQFGHINIPDNIPDDD